ncbi:transcriptional regulator AcoK [Klebsiella quasipneumoniae]|nr:transcriptional regulator AcoK [Klebsiella quasipneumoniae]
MLQQNNAIDRKQLHELASHWFVEQKLWSEAVRHALSAGKPVHSPVQDGASAQSLAEEGDIDHPDLMDASFTAQHRSFAH